MAKKDAVDDFLAGPWRTRGPQCLTCTAPKQIVEAISKFHEAKKGGAPHSLSAFWSKVLVPMGYQHTLAALRNHFRSCLGWRERG